MYFKCYIYTYLHIQDDIIIHAQDCLDRDTKKGDVSLIKVKKQVDFKIHFRWFKAFLGHVFFFIKGAGLVGLDP